MSGIEDIAAERQRQISVEGWTPEHDDEHSKGELISAALCYAIHAEVSAKLLAMGMPEAVIVERSGAAGTPPSWPWEAAWWKPGDAQRNLARAGALIAAEIDRLERAADAAHS